MVKVDVSNGVGPQRRMKAAVLAGSFGLHLIVLGWLAAGAVGLRDNPWSPAADIRWSEPPIYLEMEPRPLLPGETARVPVRPANREQSIPNRRLDGSPDSLASNPLRARREEDETPSAPLPRIAAAAPSGAPPAPADAWQVTPEAMGTAVARSLRTGPAGCRTLDGRLNPGEQQLCDDRLNEAAGRAGPLGPRTLTPSEQRRDAQFARDGAQALARYEARRRGLAGGVGVVGASPECVGGNLRGTCAGAHLRPEYQMTDDRLRNGRKME